MDDLAPKPGTDGVPFAPETEIAVEVSGVPGVIDMPGKLVFDNRVRRILVHCTRCGFNYHFGPVAGALSCCGQPMRWIDYTDDERAQVEAILDQYPRQPETVFTAAPKPTP